jgi:predicted lysophospholipase L1 biosynthesis ABC-type transport system permease subunit
MAKKADSTKKSRQTRRQGQQFKEWKAVAMGTAANAAELPPTEIQRTALEGVIGEVDQILAEQAAFRASKQTTSRRLQTLVNQGAKLSTVLKAIAKQHYGHGNEKLVEFGIQPLRSRPKPTVVPPTAPPPEAGTPGAAPTTPSTSK